jgi:hypothetical protein
MPLRARKLVLVVHIGASVGWFGATVAFLALAVIGVAGSDEQVTRSAYLIMEPVGWLVILPLNLASLVSGLISSLGTAWGLFRHYWVIAKLAINLVATVVLLMYMQTLALLAGVARTPIQVGAARGLNDASPVIHTGAAIALLLVALTLAVYKPRGLTAYGQRMAKGGADRNP